LEVCMINLAAGKCVACRAGEPTVAYSEMYQMMPQIPDWMVKEVDGMQRLERVFKFKNFAEALAFTNKIGAIAEEANHHPLIIIEYGRVTVDWWTHKIKGLHKNDFIMAAKTDELFEPV
jgi:4a-hydroxytetrahydrobiopterin dehydratase